MTILCLLHTSLGTFLLVASAFNMLYSQRVSNGQDIKVLLNSVIFQARRRSLSSILPGIKQFMRNDK